MAEKNLEQQVKELQEANINLRFNTVEKQLSKIEQLLEQYLIKAEENHTIALKSIEDTKDRVSILEESSKNFNILSQVKLSSLDLIISTDSLNHLAISILCPAIHCQINIFAILSASALFTCIIFSDSHSFNAASFNFNDSTTLFIAAITDASNFIFLT